MSHLEDDVDMEHENGTADAPQTPAHRAVRAVDAGVLVEGVFECMRTVLGELLNPEVVEAAFKKAQKQPAVKAMMSKIKVKGAAKGPGTMRSNYNIFVQDFLQNLKAAGVQSSITEISGFWKVLPADVKAGLNERYDAVKDSYNEKVKNGQAANLAEEMAAYASSHNVPAVDYLALYKKHKSAAAAASAAATPGAKATPAAAAVEDATPAAAAGEAEGAKRAAEPDSEHKHSHKKHKKDKEKSVMKDKEGAPASEEKKKKKKHKAKEEKQEESD